MTTTQTHVRIGAGVPKTIARIALARPEVFEEVRNEREDSYMPYWADLRRGWIDGDEGTHTIVAATVDEFRWRARGIEPCDCEDCTGGAR